MTAKIHPSAIIEEGAELGVGVEIGAHCYIGKLVQLGDRCKLSHHASLQGPSFIGADNEFYPFVSIGEKTQDLKYKGEPTFLEIGEGNVFREFCTVNRGTSVQEKTVIGSRNNFLAYVHIAHNCVVGNHTIFSNNATLAGHVEVEDYAVIGGLSAVHQFCRVGKHSMIGGCSKIIQDVPPFFVADGNPAEVRGVNTIGLQRHAISEEDIRHLKKVFKTLYDNELNTTQALEKIKKEFSGNANVEHLLEFVRKSQRGIIR